MRRATPVEQAPPAFHPENLLFLSFLGYIRARTGRFY
ncbi:hypothetical protein HCH_04486 [Hahella chejuensis KCTC 2396]|uniref:Uncharacterized protein n=1 Tax=Hahella chejuensis (strain KCTC 2396) TaxID=349521 RepID=Q2SDT5_HAHCH|nr:hypothetical protein HCH_04486 [Hahella chejuensis KCTC 2396]